MANLIDSRSRGTADGCERLSPILDGSGNRQAATAEYPARDRYAGFTTSQKVPKNPSLSPLIRRYRPRLEGKFGNALGRGFGGST